MGEGNRQLSLRQLNGRQLRRKQPPIKNPFSSFRNAFAKKYFPEWVKEKAPKAKKLSFLEELEALANEE